MSSNSDWTGVKDHSQHSRFLSGQTESLLMKVNTFPILKVQSSDLTCFVNFWSDQYDYKKDELYDQHIDKPFTTESILQLFEWKNGSVLSARKRKSVEKYLEPDDRITSEAESAELRTYLCRPGGTIWRIFWLHLQHPLRFPIFDQHVFRAMIYLKGQPERKLAGRESSKVDCYIDEYLPFAASFNVLPLRKLDRALWAFGRFLSLRYRFLPGSVSDAARVVDKA